jgi:RNA polymerase sigma-70 factor (ECF subfamily)
VNTAIDFYRKNQKYQLQSDLEEGLQVQDVDENIISRISADEILQLIQQLPPGYRIVFTMYVIDGYNHREIGNILGIQEGTSKSNLRSARQKLQLMIKQAYPDLYQVYALKTSQLDEN